MTFPGASYDAWKTRSPDDDWMPAPACSTCGSTWEDGGQEWDTEFVFGDDTPPELMLVPFGRCPECGWSCQPCPDIEDAYERGPFPCPGYGAPLYDGDACVNAACPVTSKGIVP